MRSMEGKGDKSVFPNGLPSCLLSPLYFCSLPPPPRPLPPPPLPAPNMACLPDKNQTFIFRALHLFVLHAVVHQLNISYHLILILHNSLPFCFYFTSQISFKQLPSLTWFLSFYLTLYLLRSIFFCSPQKDYGRWKHQAPDAGTSSYYHQAP